MYKGKSTQCAAQRRRPEQSAVHLVVRENVLTLFAAIEQGFASPLPEFVRSELEGYVHCGGAALQGGKASRERLGGHLNISRKW
jgi:hypothetical protein